MVDGDRYATVPDDHDQPTNNLKKQKENGQKGSPGKTKQGKEGEGKLVVTLTIVMK